MTIDINIQLTHPCRNSTSSLRLKHNWSSTSHVYRQVAFKRYDPLENTPSICPIGLRRRQTVGIVFVGINVEVHTPADTRPQTYAHYHWPVASYVSCQEVSKRRNHLSDAPSVTSKCTSHAHTPCKQSKKRRTHREQDRRPNSLPKASLTTPAAHENDCPAQDASCSKAINS